MSPDKPVATRIVDLLHDEALPVGSHISAQWLADRLQVSRSPVNEALGFLGEKGLVKRETNRGYFLARPVKRPSARMAARLGLGELDVVTAVYFRMAEDRLKGRLPDEFSEVLLRERYDLTPGQLHALLNRISQEGWANKKPGYGWAFSPMLTTPESLLQSYRLRLALEPAALVEPGFRLEPRVLERCRAAELHLLGGGIETDTADQLHDRGVRFHESLVEASGNPFFIDTIRRVNRIRRLLSYRSMQNRKRYKQHCHQHLQVLALLEKERNDEAAAAMRAHLNSTLRNLSRITDLLRT
jgi:DNA-binding GntR family transcriptional regulator